MQPEKLKELLVDSKLIKEDDFNNALKEAQQSNQSLENMLVEKNLISDENLGQLIANDLGFKFVNLKREGIDQNIFSIIPQIVAKNQNAIAFGKDNNGIKIAMNDPKNLDFISLMEKKTGEKVIPYYASKRDISMALDLYNKGLEQKYEELIKKDIAQIKKPEAEEVPIVKLIDTLIEYAYQNRASDIHIEPLKESIIVRFRIDGVLHKVLELPKNLLEALISRLKILAKLRTDDHFSAQDGKIVQKINGNDIDIRISIIPITNGENAVLRILSERARQYTLENLGLQGNDLDKIQNAIKKPWGMILATGPTGCGKTTTLYSILKILNTTKVNIATIEDPVEYDIEGVNQIQVNPRTNLTFAKGLKSIVRQDPDIIMVGEIRDEETAGIAINSAMTGHLVLSTLHTNDAATTLPRLIDMKVEPFLVSSTINIIIAQRLVRKICEKCRASEIIPQEKIDILKKQLDPRIQQLIDKYVVDHELTVYKSKGCTACQNTGYSGRIGIFEVMEIKENIKELIMKKANAQEIEDQAIKNGMTTMVEDGLKKVSSGVTTLDEVLRVTKE
ncbi:MAG: GspE/PulE family protein [Patescibacteria group bacterium]|jgi:type IV pilus assembly protein PilB